VWPRNQGYRLGRWPNQRRTEEQSSAAQGGQGARAGRRHDAEEARGWCDINRLTQLIAFGHHRQGIAHLSGCQWFPLAVAPTCSYWRARGRCAAGGRACRIKMIAARKRPGSGKIVAPGHGTGYFVTNPTAVEKSNAASKLLWARRPHQSPYRLTVLRIRS
jgi:hypothetical protein